MSIKKKYLITVEETVSKEFEVLAESEDDAAEMVKDKYNKGIFVLEPGNLLAKQMQIQNAGNNEYTDWFEF